MIHESDFLDHQPALPDSGSHPIGGDLFVIGMVPRQQDFQGL